MQIVDVLAMNAQQAWRNRWHARRAQPRPLLIALLAAAVALIVLIVLLRMHADNVATLLTRAIDYPLVVIVAIGWLVANTVARQRRSARQDATRSWLAALPLATTTFERHARRRIALQLLLVGVLLGGLLAAVATLIALPVRATATLLLLLTTAILLGATLGWSLGGGEPKPSRIRLLAAGSAHRDAHYPIGRWPLRHSRASADIGLHARAIGALLLSLPMGVPAYAAICIIVIGLMAFASWDLSRGLLVTATQAGPWLRSLPWVPRRATLALGLPAWIALLVALTTLAVAVLPSGVGTTTALWIVIGGSTIPAIAYIAICISQRPFGTRS